MKNDARGVGMKAVELKTDPQVFQDVLDGIKTFEIRFNDRDFKVGDEILLKETQFTGVQMKSDEPDLQFICTGCGTNPNDDPVYMNKVLGIEAERHG